MEDNKVNKFLIKYMLDINYSFQSSLKERVYWKDNNVHNRRT